MPMSRHQIHLKSRTDLFAYYIHQYCYRNEALKYDVFTSIGGRIYGSASCIVIAVLEIQQHAAVIPPINLPLQNVSLDGARFTGSNALFLLKFCLGILDFMLH